MSFDEFKVWWDAFQTLELGPSLSARSPSPDSIAALVTNGGGSVRTLMRVDFAVEAAALNCLDHGSVDYLANRQRLEQAVEDAKEYVRLFVSDTPLRRAFEDSLDALLSLLCGSEVWYGF